jgi:hypothetical protein
MAKKKPTLAIFWGDTRELLTKQERADVLAYAVLESITPEEILLRDRKSSRLILITSVDEKRLFCSLCKNEVVRSRYGKTCPSFAKCLSEGHKNGTGIKVR